ncbi:MAG: hypothetical protein APF81_17855 [Desulfosporosinus sp. BRH_c37]|nr:MAG: hypothetical protein APF81_17855 [Desulfosporosinus sp. BRH_c37]
MDKIKNIKQKLETVIIDGEEYIQSYENGNRILTKQNDKDGFEIKITMENNPQALEEFKLFVVDLASKNY